METIQPEALSVPRPVSTTVRLKPGEEKRILGGHQWVFSNEIETVEGGAEPGGLAAAVGANGQNLGIGFYNPHSLIAWRLLSRKVEPITAEFFKLRIEAALRARERLYPGERSFRLCFGESDNLPGLVIDKYEDVLVLQVLAAGMEKQIDLVAQALDSLLKPRGIYLMNDHSARVLEGLKAERKVLAGEVPPRIQIEESGLKYLIPLTEGQKTGFYFDQRENRICVARHAKGRNVLDLYSYIGAFALQTAKNGALKVLGLDSSQLAVELARENAKLNGLQDLCAFDHGHAGDVLEAFGGGAPQPFKPDFILLDPPNFVRSKKHLMNGLRAYIRLNMLALKCLEQGGLMATSTCSHHVSREDFLKVMREAASRAHRRLRVLELRTQAGDHPILLQMPETQYLHFALFKVM